MASMNVESDHLPERSVYRNVHHKKETGELFLTSEEIAFQSSTSTARLTISWIHVIKHQVSPASYPKPLLKLILDSSASKKTITFQFAQRSDLDQARQEVTRRLMATKNPHKRQLATLPHHDNTNNNNKRIKSSAFGDSLDSTAQAVTRASLLAAHHSLRQQHAHLVLDTKTVSEDDFWETHHHLLQEEYARISGMAKAGTSSLMQSHLPIAKGGKVTLGVEEMRQIFILYPAVHKAYEEKVPLELSDEQFWRKYLESEYFHRDRGRVGSAAAAPGKNAAAGPSLEEQEARAAAVGTDDMFSRYDQKLRLQQIDPEQSAAVTTTATADATVVPNRQWGRKLAVGQFDLASTFATERGDLLEGPRDNHPPSTNDDGKGARVINKYNRHWAMVLHPEEAVAGADLTQVSRGSVNEVLEDDEDANAAGGLDAEMRRLVDFAQATEEEANHAAEVGHEDFAPLRLKNVEAYYAGRKKEQDVENDTSAAEADQRYGVFVKAIAAKTQNLANALASEEADRKYTLSSRCFPNGELGRNLLSALTRKMAMDSRTESASLEMVKQLPDDFRERLKEFFRRSSELLRHFFGLRKLEAEGDTSHRHKLARIVHGMETFYREMEGFRKDLPQSETGKLMAKMCLPIMDQLDWAFQLNREGRGGGTGGGFVTVQ